MDIRGKRVVITGGAGFIGSHLIEHLLTLDCQVVVVDDLSAGKVENLPKNVRPGTLLFHKLSILDVWPLCEAFKNADVVFHLATQNVRLSLRQPSYVSEVNVKGTLNVLEAATRAKVKRLLYCSSSEVNGTARVVPSKEDYVFDPETIYGASKLAGEYYTKVFFKSGWLDTVIARPYNNYGPRAHASGISEELIPKFAMAALQGKALEVYGDGSQTRDFIYVTETASFLTQLLENDKCSGEVFNVCRGKEVSVLEIARLINRITESRSEVVHLPSRQNDVLRLWGDNTKLSERLGRTPAIDIEDGLRLTVGWYKQQLELREQPMHRSSWMTGHAAWPREDWMPKANDTDRPALH